MRNGNSDPSRRAFLKSTALTAVTASAVAALASCAHHEEPKPIALHTEDKTMPKPLVIGIGHHTYEVQDDWAKLPQGKEFGNTHGVCETADGRIFIHSPSKTGDSVAEFDPDGKFIR